MKKEIKLNYELLKIDDNTYGGDQEWYKKYIQRLSGCAPTTASTIIMYEKRMKDNSIKYTKKEFLELMEDMWNYITPGKFGVNKLDYYSQGFVKYINDNNISLNEKVELLISKNKKNRPSNEEVYNYIFCALENNHPVAFLNLNNGKEKLLDSWHWVCIVEIKYEKDTDTLNSIITDGGILKEINLGLWLLTSNKEGGFIYFK